MAEVCRPSCHADADGAGSAARGFCHAGGNLPLAPLLDQDEYEPVLEQVAVTGNGLAGTVLAMHARMSESHLLHVAEMARLQDAFLESETRLFRLIGTRDRIPLPISVQGRVPRAFTRNDLERLLHRAAWRYSARPSAGKTNLRARCACRSRRCCWSIGSSI